MDIELLTKLLPSSSSEEDVDRLIGKYHIELELRLVGKLIELADSMQPDEPLVKLIEDYNKLQPGSPEGLELLLSVEDLSTGIGVEVSAVKVTLLDDYIRTYLPKLSKEEQTNFWHALEDQKDQLDWSAIILKILQLPTEIRTAAIRTISLSV